MKHKAILLKKLNNPRSLFLIVVIGLILFFSLSFLSSIHYRVSDYMEYVLFVDHVKFKPYKNEFELFTKQMYIFVDDHPDFPETFTGECHLTEDGLVFFKKDIDYPDNVYIHSIIEEEWDDAVISYHKAFPEWFQFSEGTSHIFSNYIVFSSYIAGGRLVYTRDGKYPKELIDSYWETNRFVYVRKHSRGWYEVQLFNVR